MIQTSFSFLAQVIIGLRVSWQSCFSCSFLSVELTINFLCFQTLNAVADGEKTAPRCSWCRFLKSSTTSTASPWTQRPMRSRWWGTVTSAIEKATASPAAAVIKMSNSQWNCQRHWTKNPSPSPWLAMVSAKEGALVTLNHNPHQTDPLSFSIRLLQSAIECTVHPAPRPGIFTEHGHGSAAADAAQSAYQSAVERRCQEGVIRLKCHYLRPNRLWPSQLLPFPPLLFPSFPLGPRVILVWLW